MLDKYLLERIEYITEYNNRHTMYQSWPMLLTNAFAASRWSDDELRKILDGSARMSFSIYGMDAEEHEAMTGIKGAYEHTVRQIIRIVHLGGNRRYGFLFRALKEDAVSRALRWLAKHIGPDWREISCGEPEVLTGYSNWGGVVDTSRPLPFVGAWADFHDFDRNDFNFCPAPANQMKFDVEGNLYFCPCYSVTGTGCLGNIRETSLENLLNGAIAQQLWKEGPLQCRLCSWAAYPGRLGIHLHSLLENTTEN
jgi:radical SAM protein with 4Fe4S-binding SPASM domain